MAIKYKLLKNTGDEVTLSEYNTLFGVNNTDIICSFAETEHQLVKVDWINYTQSFENVGVLYQSNGTVIDGDETRIYETKNSGKTYVGPKTVGGFAINDTSDKYKDCYSILSTLYKDYKSSSWAPSLDTVVTSEVTYIPNYEIIAYYTIYDFEFSRCSLVNLKYVLNDTTISHDDAEYNKIHISTNKWRLPNSSNITVTVVSDDGYYFDSTGKKTKEFDFETDATNDEKNETKSFEASYVGTQIITDYPSDTCSETGIYKIGDTVYLSDKGSLTSTDTITKATSKSGYTVSFVGSLPLKETSDSDESTNLAMTGSATLIKHNIVSSNIVCTNWSSEDGETYENNSTQPVVKYMKYTAQYSKDEKSTITSTEVECGDITLPVKGSSIATFSSIYADLAFEWDNYIDDTAQLELSPAVTTGEGSPMNSGDVLNRQIGIKTTSLSDKIIINNIQYDYGVTFNPGTFESLLDFNNHNLFVAAYEKESSKYNVGVTLPSVAINEDSRDSKIISFECPNATSDTTISSSSEIIYYIDYADDIYWLTDSGVKYEPGKTATFTGDTTLTLKYSVKVKYSTIKLSDIKVSLGTGVIGYGWFDNIEYAKDPTNHIDDVLDDDYEITIDNYKDAYYYGIKVTK